MIVLSATCLRHVRARHTHYTYARAMFTQLQAWDTKTLDFCCCVLSRSEHNRGIILELARELSILAEERRVALSEFHCADEVFTTGTMGEASIKHDIIGVSRVRSSLETYTADFRKQTLGNTHENNEMFRVGDWVAEVISFLLINDMHVVKFGFGGCSECP